MRTKILKILANDSRISLDQIAIMLGTSLEEVKRIVKELEEEKIILKYTTVINWEKAGIESTKAIIHVKVTPQREVGFDAVAERIYRFPEVQSVTLMSGDDDLSVTIEGKSMKEVAMFVAKKLATLENVQSTKTHFVLKRYKVAGTIFDETEEDRRQMISL
ncbi:MAG: Lrp/AsnC family transcriptional regulator [Desulfitobacteriaceae bacterium]|nr:Lrp/AsnC family transcriptional regulator [Desulfitobacteriaceae bacterium]MDD4752816.1 Lrp/AsnC family transcriptional regulator [Desulfitobacteriaceae bacterium]